MSEKNPDLMALFDEAIKITDPSERSTYLDRVCAGNSDLRQQLEALLAGQSEPTRFSGSDATCAHEPLLPDAIDNTVNNRTGAYFPVDDKENYNSQSAYPSPTGLGTVIAERYTLVELIGEGGMGAVYLASQAMPVKRQVALKLIKTGMDSKGVLARFDAERQALALMDHPNIARIYDGGVTASGQPFFVMELVKGIPLTEYSDSKRLSVDARLQLFVSVCQAVQHAHQKGIIHRDLKPGNVLVTEIDGKPTPKVIDFGVAKATEQKLTDMSFADLGAIVGTPAYMSPEQADPSSMDIDTRTDVYALGVMLYELLTGSPPIDASKFKRGAILEILRMVREVEPPRPSAKLSTADTLPSIAANRSIEPVKLARLLTGELDWVVMKALEKDRTRRYDSANELAQDLQRYLANEVVEARPPSRWYQLQKFVTRNKAQVVAASLVLLALVAGIIGTSFAMMRAEDAREAEKNQRVIAENLADRNGKLAASEARARQEREAQLERTRAVLFTSQLERVGAILEKDPTAAIELLNDAEACPRSLRDIAWAFAEKSAKRREYASLRVPAGQYLAISPNGKWVAVAETLRSPGRRPTSKVTVLEVSTGMVKTTLPEFADSVELMTFTPNGSALALVADGPLRRLVALAPGAPPTPSVVPGKVQLWDIESVKLVTTFEEHTDRITAIEFSVDGTRLVTSSLDKTARIWDVPSGKSEFTFEGHTMEVTAIALSPDGKRLATGGLDNSIKLWDVENRKLLDSWTPATNPDAELAGLGPEQARSDRLSGPAFVFGRPTDTITGLDFSDDGTSLVSSNSNCQIEVRDATTGQIRTTIRDLKHPVWWVRFHRDGKSVFGYQRLTLNAQQQIPAVNRWDVSTGQLVFTMPVSTLSSVSTAYCKEQGLLAIMSGTSCVIHDLDAMPEIASFNTEKVVARTAVPVFNLSGNTLLVGIGPLIYAWDVETGRLQHTLKGHINHVQALAVCSDGRTLASSANSPLDPEGKRTKDDIHLWDLTTGTSVGKLALNSEHIPSIAFSKDGRRLAAVQIDSFELGNPKAVVSVWDMMERKKIFEKDHPEIGFAGYAHDGASVAFNPADGGLVSVAGHSLCIWELEKQTPQRIVRTGRSNIPDPSSLNEFVGLAISPDGKSIFTINQTGRFNATVFDLNQWNCASGELVKKVRNFGGRKMSFSPDGSNLISAAAHRFEVWDTLTLQRRGSFPICPLGQQAFVTLSPSNQTLATVSLPTLNTLGSGSPSAAEIKLWDISRSSAVMVFPGRNEDEISFSPDGKMVVETDRTLGRTRFWELSTGQLASTFDTGQQILDSVISPDGRYMAGADLVGTAQDKFAAKIRHPETDLLKLTALLSLWDTKTKKSLQFEVGKGVIMSEQFSPDGTKIALVLDTSVGDGQVLNTSFSLLLWNIAESKVEATYSFRDVAAINVPEFHPDGQLLAIPVIEGSVPSHKLKVLFIDLQKRESLPAIDLNAKDTLDRSVRFVPEGKRLVVLRGAETGEQTIWDLQTGKQLNEPVPEVFRPTNRSPDGRYELKNAPGGVEIIDRTLKPPSVVSHRRKP
jgi:WD40 repeat protein/serine/threonine protein kinase